MDSQSPVSVTVTEIITGKDTGLPVVTLSWGQSVTYKLGAGARALFQYRAQGEAISLIANGRDVLADVDIARDDSALTVTIKPNTGPWTAKATLYFLARLDEPPAPGGLDPGIGNTGGPP